MWVIKMENVVTCIALIIEIIALVFVINVFIRNIKEDIKVYKTLNDIDKDFYIMLIFIILFPFVLLMFDYYNLFSLIFPDYYANITRDYDWLSFVATYSGTIISAIFLIYVTTKDRRENLKAMREAQRPYLEVTYQTIEKDWLDAKKDKTFNHGNYLDKFVNKNDYLTLCIKNNGESVAIIDVNDTIVKLSYKKEGEIVTEEINLNFSIKRLSLKSGEEVFIKFCRNELYHGGNLLKSSTIESSKIYYKDLFNKKYLDECQMVNDVLEVIHDNETIE